MRMCVGALDDGRRKSGGMWRRRRSTPSRRLDRIRRAIFALFCFRVGDGLPLPSPCHREWELESLRRRTWAAPPCFLSRRESCSEELLVFKTRLFRQMQRMSCSCEMLLITLNKKLCSHKETSTKKMDQAVARKAAKKVVKRTARQAIKDALSSFIPKMVKLLKNLKKKFLVQVEDFQSIQQRVEGGRRRNGRKDGETGRDGEGVGE